jgi:predicted short-subunit dehydrogenase-like oxidoreductase (DUF2520 family)
MNVSFIGSGNVATHLAALFLKAGHSVNAVYSAHPAHARRLAKKIHAQAVPEISGTLRGDCVIVAVQDDSIPAVVKEIPATDCLVLHTSGAEPLSLLGKKFRNCGVLYPVQTFSMHSPSPESIPFCIEASNTASLAKIKKLARSVSRQVQVMNSKERKNVHLAAVFTNNFSNHLFVIAENILKKKNLKLELLLPLIDETVAKIRLQSPADVQTGPAQRGDEQTMREHLALLGTDRTAKSLYRLFSQSIRERVRRKK